MFEKDEESTGDNDSTQDFLDEGTGEEEVEAEDEVVEEDSESDEEEQSLEDQDNLEEEDDEPAEEKGFKFKDAKTGNFDWQKINQRVGGPELEKSFRESQKTITKVSQENKELKGRYEQAEGHARLFQQFDQLVQRNPEVRAAIQRALTGGQQPRNPQEDFLKIPGVNPEDPLLPVLAQLKQQNDQLVNQYQSWESQQQQARATESFRQGLMSAKDRFTELVGREPTADELRKVAGQMQQTRHINGADWVPSLFLEEIREGTKQKFFESTKQKKILPKNPKTGSRTGATSGKKSLRDTFEEEWAALQDAE